MLLIAGLILNDMTWKLTVAARVFRISALSGLQFAKYIRQKGLKERGRVRIEIRFIGLGCLKYCSVNADSGPNSRPGLPSGFRL